METKDYMEEYCLWISSDAFDENTKKELEAIAGNEDEIKDRFYRSLEFGTAGLRGAPAHTTGASSCRNRQS